MTIGLVLSLLLVIAPNSGSRSLPSAEKRTLYPHFLALLLIAWLAMRELTGEPADRGALLGYLASIALIGILAIVARRGGIERRDLLALLTVLLSTAIVWSGITGTSWTPCQEGKCTAVGSLYRAGFPSENTAALLAGLLTLLAAWETGRRRAAIALLGATVLFLSGGRTGLVAVAAALVVSGLLARYASRPGRQQDSIRRVPSLVFCAAVGAAAVLTASRVSAADFSNRGRIWNTAMNLVGTSSLAGRRISDWARLRSLSVLPDHSAHSLYIHVYFGGGFVALGILLIFFASCMASVTASNRVDLALGLSLIVFFMLSGLTEVVWNPATADAFAILLIPLLALSPDSTRNPDFILVAGPSNAASAPPTTRGAL